MFTTAIMNEIGEKYNKPQLEKGFLPHIIQFYSKDIFIKADTILTEILQKSVAKKPVSKAELVYVCFSVFENKDIYSKFLVTLPPFIQLLIEKLLWVTNMSETEIELLLGEPVSLPGANDYEGNILKNSYNFFSSSRRNAYYTSGNNPYILSLVPAFKKVLMEYYPKPLHYNFIWLNKLPPVKNKFNAADIILQEMPRLISYHLQDAIKYSSGGRPTEATLAKLHRSCGLTEFFPDQMESIGKLRTRLLAGVLYGLKINHIGIDSVQLFKAQFKALYLKLNSPSFILSSIKGWGHMQIDDYNPNSAVEFFQLFKKLEVDKWISSQNFLDYINFRFLDLKPVSEYACNNRLYTESVDSTYGYKDKTYVASDSNIRVNTPFIKGTVFLLASLGMVEIAFDDITDIQLKKKNYSIYDSLNFFKLTELGAYILGLTEVYTPAILQQQNKLHFSEDSMMITAEGDLPVLDLLLGNYTEKTGVNRYKVTGAQFLKDCKNLKDIDQKVILFKNVIATPLPAYWNQQFINWKLNSLKISKDFTTVVFSIPSTEKELHKLLAQDAILKGLILKAENFNILVKSNNVSKFKNRMKEFGFLVE